MFAFSETEMSVVKLLSSFATFFKVRLEKPIVDNAIFRLHYRFTCVFFLASSALITAVDLLGKPILCMAGDLKKPEPELLNTFCWIQRTFTITVPSVDHAYPGVGPLPGSNSVDETVRIHAYYQWVPFVLFFQGLLFYLPHAIWKRQEAGMVGKLTKGARELSLDSKEKADEKKQRGSLLSDYLYETMGTRGYFGVCHVFCELFNLVNAMGNIYAIDTFLGGTFFDYGWKIFEISSLNQWERHDKMARVFPRMAKCTFNTYGASGNIQNIDALCILPLNVFNEKIYIFVWFWLVILSVVSLMALFYRALIVVSPVFRRYVFRRILPTADPDSTFTLSQKLGYSDWLLLFLLGKNLQSDTFRELLNDLAGRLDRSQLEV